MFATRLWLTFHLLALVAPQNSGGDPPPDNQLVGWQAGGDRRGTWDITSNCLFTIFACTWSVQHLNVPGPDDGKWSRWLRSLKWMIITILLPEMMVLHAVFELAMALEALRSMEKHNPRCVKLPWWLPQQGSSPSLLDRLSKLPSLLSSCLCFSNKQKATDTEKHPARDDPKWTLCHCFFANMGGFSYGEKNKPQFPITALQLAKAEVSKTFERLEVTEEDINDRSKLDWFAKGVAALQFLQLALSLIVRTSKGLAFSQLETITLVFAVCGAVIYLVYLYKPQKVETRIHLTCGVSSQQESPKNESAREPRASLSSLRFEENESAREQRASLSSLRFEENESAREQRASPSNLRYEKTYDSFWDILMNEQSLTNTTHEKAGEENFPERIPNDNIPISQNRVAHPGVLLLAFASGLFGAMHAIAWHFEFPSPVEKILWQTATVVAAGSPVVGLITIPLAQLTISAGDPQLFAGKCLRLMREFSWHVSDKAPVIKAYKELERILMMPDTTSEEARRHYASIISPEENSNQALHLAQELRNFLEMRDSFSHLKTPPLDLHSDNDFKDQFGRLVDVIEGKESKKVHDTAKTNVFPRKSLFHKAFNRAILYAATFLYCLSRLSLLAVALSSLRQMPESVYVNTPWPAYIPTVGSTR